MGTSERNVGGRGVTLEWAGISHPGKIRNTQLCHHATDRAENHCHDGSILKAQDLKVLTIVGNPAFLVCLGAISGSFGFAMGMLNFILPKY